MGCVSVLLIRHPHWSSLLIILLLWDWYEPASSSHYDWKGVVWNQLVTKSSVSSLTMKIPRGQWKSVSVSDGGSVHIFTNRSWKHKSSCWRTAPLECQGFWGGGFRANMSRSLRTALSCHRQQGLGCKSLGLPAELRGGGGGAIKAPEYGHVQSSKNWHSAVLLRLCKLQSCTNNCKPWRGKYVIIKIILYCDEKAHFKLFDVHVG